MTEPVAATNSPDEGRHEFVSYKFSASPWLCASCGQIASARIHCPPVGDATAAKCPAPECVDDGCTGQCEHWPSPVGDTTQPPDPLDRLGITLTPDEQQELQRRLEKRALEEAEDGQPASQPTDEGFDSPPKCTCTAMRGDEPSCPWHGITQPQPTDDDLRFVRRFPDKCCAEVSRDGQSQPCDKPAVAVAHGDTDGWRCGSDSWWPVCPHHSRGRRMVPLAELLAALDKAGAP